MFETYKGKRVFVTGHTGFKGSWLCEMLLMAGADVYGYALKPPTKPALFNQLKLAKRIKSHVIGDIRDLTTLTKAVRAAKPDFVFHLAAQPLVRLSYREPVETFAANVMGTVNLLEAVRKYNRPCSVVCITTDKCYENDNSGRAFRENDPMGGSDPYSASKGACEIAIASYRRSFFGDESTVKLASARAGNVIGGGDWAEDRIVPDAMRAFLGGGTLVVRNAKSTRPWQHVLEPLSGYLMLGLSPFAEAFNFGPDEKTVKTVGQLVKELTRYFPKARIADQTNPKAPREAKLLRLDSTKAKRLLDWKPRWDFRQTIRATAEWYKGVAAGESPRELCVCQIEDYMKVRESSSSTNYTNYTKGMR